MIVVLKMGRNLRVLRQTKDLTQEELAEAIGVSPQAISRWENDVALPDITLLPGLADFFDVTLDELMGREVQRRKQQIWELCSRSQKARGRGDLLLSERILREGLQRFPGEESISSELALTLTLLGGELRIQEAVRLAQCVLEFSHDLKLRATTTANLCLLYRLMGQTVEAVALAGTMPHVYESREWNCAVAEGSEQALEEMLQFTLAAMAKCILQWDEPGMLLAQGLSQPLPPWQESMKHITRFLSR